MTKVSVVVPTYRREQELLRALESLGSQTYQPVEIILVDDNGCKEWNTTVKQVEYAFRRKYPEADLKVIVNLENIGSARTRNVGIAVASGDYVTFLDDDDIYLPKKIENQLSFMEQEYCDYSITDLELYSKEGKLIDRRIRSYIKDTSQKALQRYHFMYHLTGTDTLMFKSEYIRRIQGFAPIDVGDEFYLMQRAIEGGGKFGYLPGCEVIAYVHTGKGGLSSGDRKIEGENLLYEYKKTYLKQLPDKDVRYIKVRHYAVIAYAELRRKHYWQFTCNAVKAFFASPMDMLSILKQ